MERQMIYNNLVKWWKSSELSTEDEDRFDEFLSYINQYTEEMYYMALIMNFTGKDVRNVLKFSEEGKLVLLLINTKSYYNEIKPFIRELMVNDFNQKIGETDIKK